MSLETDRPGEFCYNYSTSNSFTNMFNVLTTITNCDSHSPTRLDFSLSWNDTSKRCSSILSDTTTKRSRYDQTEQKA